MRQVPGTVFFGHVSFRLTFVYWFAIYIRGWAAPGMNEGGER